MFIHQPDKWQTHQKRLDPSEIRRLKSGNSRRIFTFIHCNLQCLSRNRQKQVTQSAATGMSVVSGPQILTAAENFEANFWPFHDLLQQLRLPAVIRALSQVSNFAGHLVEIRLINFPRRASRLKTDDLVSRLCFRWCAADCGLAAALKRSASGGGGNSRKCADAAGSRLKKKR